MKKRILALLLAFSMMLSLLPVSALADTGGGIDSAVYASNGSLPDLVMTPSGFPDTSNAASRTEDNKTIWYGTDWTYDGDTLTLENGSYDFFTTKPTTKNGKVLALVECTVVVKNGATITGGRFHAMFNYGTVENSLLVSDGIINRGGTMTNCLFRRTSLPEGVANYHKLTEVNNSTFDATLPNAPYTFSDWETYYFTGTPTLTVKVDNNPIIQCINGRADYGDLKPSGVSGYYTFTPNAGEDVVLNLNYYITDLVITKDGFPDTTGREPIYQDNNSSKPIIGYKGDGWTYMLNSVTNEKGVLALMQRSNHTANYIFSENWNHSTAIECDVTVKDSAQIHNGVFHGAVTLNASAVASESIFTGTVTLEGISNQISWSYFSKNARLVGFENGTIWHCVFAGDTSGYTFSTDTEYCLFASKPADLTTYELRTEDDKEFSATLYSNFLQGKCPEKLTGQKMYVQKDANLIVRRTDDLEITDGTACTETDWSGWYYRRPYQSSDTILKRKYTLTVENGTLKGTTDTQGNFGSGTSITVQANAPTDTNTFFTGWTVTPADTNLMKGTSDVDLTQSTITFDMPIVIAPDGLTLTATYAPYVTDLEMTPRGFPVTTGREPIYDSTKQVIGCKGEGWKYENDTLTLESGSYDFTNTKPITKGGDALTFVQCEVVVKKEATITGGWFHAMLNHGTVKNSLLGSYDIINDGGTMTDCLFSRTTPPVDVANCHKLTEVNNSIFNATLLNAPSGFTGCETYYFTGTPTLKVKLPSNKKLHHINGRTDYGGLKPSEDVSGYYTFTPPTEEDIVLNDSIIHEPFTMTNGYPTASNGGKTACKGEGWEYILGDPEHGDFLFLSNAQIDFSKISDGSPVECKLFIGHGVAVKGGTFNGDVINYGGILGGTFNGAVENHGTIENGVFNGAVTNIDPGTVSDSITGTGTLNGKPITPNAYTLTVTGGGLVNGKTSAVVEAGDEVRLTVGEMQEGMSFNYWDLPTALTQALTDSSSGGFSNKVEPLTFTMPDLSEYTEDKSFTIRLDIRPAELPDDDDGPSVLGTMATVAVGGAAAGILVCQGVSLGVDSYLQLSLPGGVAVPTNRRELVKLLWETAGKPDVVLPALYGDVSAEDGELQKATRWAIDNGLVKPADETDASRFDPDRSVSKYEVARAWFKVQQMLK